VPHPSRFSAKGGFLRPDTSVPLLFFAHSALLLKMSSRLPAEGKSGAARSSAFNRAKRTVISSGATRLSLPRRSSARRAAQSRDRGTISPPCNHPLHLASATRHSERSPRSEESLFAFSAYLCVLRVSALSFSDSQPRCSKSSRNARPFFAPCGLAVHPPAAFQWKTSSFSPRFAAAPLSSKPSSPPRLRFLNGSETRLY